MTISFCCIQLNRATVETIASYRENFGVVAQVTGLGGSAAMALFYISNKVWGAAVSFFTGGSFTTLGALIASSPLFIGTLAVVTGAAVLSLGGFLICEYARRQLQQQPQQA